MFNQATCSDKSGWWWRRYITLKRRSTIILHAVHPRRQFWTSYSPPWELEISHSFRSIKASRNLSEVANMQIIIRKFKSFLKEAVIQRDRKHLPYFLQTFCRHDWHPHSVSLRLTRITQSLESAFDLARKGKEGPLICVFCCPRVSSDFDVKTYWRWKAVSECTHTQGFSGRLQCKRQCSEHNAWWYSHMPPVTEGGETRGEAVSLCTWLMWKEKNNAPKRNWQTGEVASQHLLVSAGKDEIREYGRSSHRKKCMEWEKRE
jgi:hypothetical protein